MGIFQTRIMKKYSFGPYSASTICYKGDADGNGATDGDACWIVVDAVIPAISAIATIFAIVFTWMNKKKEAAMNENVITEDGIENTTYADVEAVKTPEPTVTVTETKSPEPMVTEQSPTSRKSSRKSSKRSSVVSSQSAEL